MQKNYENNPEAAQYIKQNLFQKYPEIFEKYEMDKKPRLQVCNLAEFLIKEHPEKYDKTAGTRMDYENNDDLTRIYALIDAEKEEAIFINTNTHGKMPEGEFGTYDLQRHRFTLTNEEIKQTIEKQLKRKNSKICKRYFFCPRNSRNARRNDAENVRRYG